jgi:hypothetical protein
MSNVSVWSWLLCPTSIMLCSILFVYIILCYVPAIFIFLFYQFNYFSLCSSSVILIYFVPCLIYLTTNFCFNNIRVLLEEIISGSCLFVRLLTWPFIFVLTCALPNWSTLLVLASRLFYSISICARFLRFDLIIYGIAVCKEELIQLYVC